jgi:hypothetical protein
MDVLVAVQQGAGSAGKNVSAVQVLKEKYQEGGLKTLSQFGTKGLMARVAHVALTTMLMKSLSGEIYLAYSNMMYPDDE